MDVPKTDAVPLDTISDNYHGYGDGQGGGGVLKEWILWPSCWYGLAGCDSAIP